MHLTFREINSKTNNNCNSANKVSHHISMEINMQIRAAMLMLMPLLCVSWVALLVQCACAYHVHCSGYQQQHIARTKNAMQHFHSPTLCIICCILYGSKNLEAPTEIKLSNIYDVFEQR